MAAGMMRSPARVPVPGEETDMAVLRGSREDGLLSGLLPVAQHLEFDESIFQRPQPAWTPVMNRLKGPAGSAGGGRAPEQLRVEDVEALQARIL